MGNLHTGFILGCGLALVAARLFASSVDDYNPAFDMSVAETHWAFVPLKKPEVPKVGSSEVVTSVDAFIAAKLESQGLGFNKLADKRTLIRRLTYDLTGLSPTYEEVQAFLDDASPDAYSKLVERLLASPAYGERWTRHWLDVARYSDTKGIFRRGRYSFSHTYRDYVIEAFNSDKPYDEFILEQIAADQLEDRDDEKALAAMGFLTLGRTFFGRKDFIIDDQIDVVTRGLQGLTVSCARCHDHKSDPIPTADYYSLHGIFNSSQDAPALPVISMPESQSEYESFLEARAEVEARIEKKTVETVDKFLNDERSLAGNYLNAVQEGRFIEDEEDFKVFAGSHDVRPEILKLWIGYLENEANREHPVLRDWFREYEDGDRDVGKAVYNDRFGCATKGESKDSKIIAFFQESDSPFNPARTEVRQWIRRVIGGAIGDLQGELQALDWTHSGAPMRAHLLVDTKEPKNSQIYKRGDKNRLGEEVPRQYLQILNTEGRKPYEKGSGRLQLAQEIADPENPLTARVYVNRVWGWHMGEGLVDTPSDFGVQTPEPLHVDLLNWLAASFIESGWSTKELHRQIVHSRTYRQASDPDARNLEADPINELWHYFPRVRLDFESMRDSILAFSGNLDRTVGGLQFDIEDPEANRRTLYGYIDRQYMPGIFRTFDHPSPDVSSPGRFETTVPQQALFLMNNPFMIRNAESLANRIKDGDLDSPEERIQKAYRILYQRDANEEEVLAGVAFLEQNNRNETEETNSEDRWALYAQALLQSNEAMYID